MRRLWPVLLGFFFVWALIYLVYAQFTTLMPGLKRGNVSASDSTSDSTDDEQVVEIRWFVGLGTGTSLEQITAEEQVVTDFNAVHDHIKLVLEVATIGGAYDLFSTQIATGYFPDVIGPVSLGEANPFYRQWLSLSSFIEETDFDTSQYPVEMMSFYETETGLVSLPFAVASSAIFYNPALFDEAGLAYPPQIYGQPYLLDGQEVPWSWATLSEVARRLTLDWNGYNATQPEFDRRQIVQVGFAPQGQNALALATFFGTAQIYAGTEPGEYRAAIPAHWKTAWRWWYEAIWGLQPFMASGGLARTDEFGNGNLFGVGKAAMALSQATYTCCLGNFLTADRVFQLGVLPESADGMVHGRVTETSFRIWKDTPHPKEAFTVLVYLLTKGRDKLLPAYDAMSAQQMTFDPFFAQKAAEYPFVTLESWDVLVQSLAYSDHPSADQYLPNRNEAVYRIQIFGEAVMNTPDLDFDAAFYQLQTDLTFIFNKE